VQLHLLYHFLTVELEVFNFFISEKLEFLGVFGEVEALHELDAHPVEAGVGEIIHTPHIHALMNHSEESARQFDEVGHIFIRLVLVDLSHEIAATPLNVSNVRTVLDYFSNLRQQRLLNRLYHAPAIRLHSLFQELEGADLSPWRVSQKQG
jgi:hypothetical protein